MLYHVSGNVQSLHVQSPLTLPTTLWDRRYCYLIPMFWWGNWGIEILSVSVQAHTANRCRLRVWNRLFGSKLCSQMLYSAAPRLQAKTFKGNIPSFTQADHSFVPSLILYGAHTMKKSALLGMVQTLKSKQTNNQQVLQKPKKDVNSVWDKTV